MIEALLTGAVGLLLLLVVGVGILPRRMSFRGLTELAARFDHLEKAQDRTERVAREEIAKNRDETAAQAKHLREEVGASVKGASDSLVTAIGEISNVQRSQLEAFAAQLARLTESNQTAAKE